MTKQFCETEFSKPLKLSCAAIESFVKCPRCFYLKWKHKISQPPFPSYSLNLAVDTLLKKDFDYSRGKELPPFLWKKINTKIFAIPFAHPDFQKWRSSGISFYHQPTNFLIYGKIDDVWINENNELIIVEYKATSKDKKNDIDLEKEYYKSYKREIEIYHWLFRKNNFKMANYSYFLFVNVLKNKKTFEGLIHCDFKLILYQPDDSWVEKKIFEICECLNKETLPPSDPNCKYCQYRSKSQKIEKYE